MKPIQIVPQPDATIVPFYPSPAACGFTSPAADYLQDTLSLDQLLIRHPAATFFARAQGRSMEGTGIFDGDILIIDRALSPGDGDVILALWSGELIVKRLVYRQGRPELHSDNAGYAPIRLNGEEVLDVWGVVTEVIHRLR